MSLLTVIAIAAMFAVGAWLLMQRHLLHVLLGVCVLGHAANLLIVVAGTGASNRPALIDEGAEMMNGAHADPLPQALVLTAIVIGFGVIAFGLALAARSFREQGTDDIDAMANADTIPSPTGRSAKTAKEAA